MRHYDEIRGIVQELGGRETVIVLRTYSNTDLSYCSRDHMRAYISAKEIAFRSRRNLLTHPARLIARWPGQYECVVKILTARFKKANTGVPSYLRVYWSWKAPTSFWHAPNNARLAFAGTSVLFKLYVIRDMATPDERPENDPSVELMSRFLAELKMEQF